MIKNLLTFDLEDWYHGNFLEEGEIAETQDRVVEPTEKILKILEATGNQATFFVLGCVAEKYPELIKKIHQNGHEIASHSYKHNIIYKLNREDFETDLKKSISILESIINDKVIGYRAPYWSIYQDMDWVWEVLSENGIVYDSSVYPFKTYLYGDNNVPRFKYYLNWSDDGNRIVEIPPSVLAFGGRRIPFSGGFYFRLLPYRIVKWAIQRTNINDGRPVVFYLHPYEIDPKKQKNSKGFKNNFILHVNIKKAEAKLFRLLSDFKFVNVKDYLNNN